MRAATEKASNEALAQPSSRCVIASSILRLNPLRPCPLAGFFRVEAGGRPCADIPHAQPRLQVPKSVLARRVLIESLNPRSKAKHRSRLERAAFLALWKQAEKELDMLLSCGDPRAELWLTAMGAAWKMRREEVNRRSQLFWERRRRERDMRCHAIRFWWARQAVRPAAVAAAGMPAVAGT